APRSTTPRSGIRTRAKTATDGQPPGGEARVLEARKEPFGNDTRRGPRASPQSLPVRCSRGSADQPDRPDPHTPWPESPRSAERRRTEKPPKKRSDCL